MTTLTQPRPVPWHLIARWFATRFRHWRLRRRVQSLDDLDDQMLDDIGVTRDEIRRASRTPLHLNASEELYRAAFLRRNSDR
ncbi:MAG: DUF1127 domain-containing protein [Pseudomonadota bacterium]